MLHFVVIPGSQISTNQQSPIASTTNITNPQLNTIAQSPRSTQPIIPTPISISDQSSIASPTTPTQQIVEPVIAQAATTPCVASQSNATGPGPNQ